MISLTVQDLSCWQRSTQTDTTENNTTLAVQLVMKANWLVNYRSTESICCNFSAIFGCFGPNVWPQWSTPRKWAINSCQSGLSNSSSRWSITPLSTVSRSFTLNDGNGKDRANLLGNKDYTHINFFTASRVTDYLHTLCKQPHQMNITTKYKFGTVSLLSCCMF